MTAGERLTAPAVGSYVRTPGGSTGRVVNAEIRIRRGDSRMWQLVKLDGDHGLLWYRADQLTLRE